MSNVLGVLIFVGLMFLMSKLGIGCCGGHSKHSEQNNDEKGKLPNENTKLAPEKIFDERK